jgi:hypothetical protein
VKIQVWLESTIAAVGGLLVILTLIWPDWIESVFGWSPDHGDGTVEWLIVAGLTGFTIACGLLARMSWRRLASATA